MKKVLVAGATGGIGYALVNELTARGIEVIAFARGEQKLTALFNDNHLVTIFPGDALVKEDMMEAAEGAEILFHAVSFPYQNWLAQHPLCIENMLAAAQAHSAKIVLADNIYAYGFQDQHVKESSAKNPQTKKGKIRLEMEKRLLSSDIDVIIAHMPDLYGPLAVNTILFETIKGAAQNKNAIYVGNKQKRREFLYTIDGAKAIIELALKDKAYNQNWNIPSAHPISGIEIESLLRGEQYRKKIMSVSAGMIALLGIFNPFMREMKEMMYLTEKPVILNGEKYEAEVGPVPRTPYKDGLRKTLEWTKEYLAEKTNK
ncbi:MAG: SDR family NAD(P)-dependent oxidoreductase [Cytobacillus gottheilii]|uniref:SDR family NAD(P)-dependent oxidoreductase n=1 Tax=Cytobacillus gottheilii TaxID=859144 RepID=UPI00083363BE|nr:SDR family NAD(P)-dependent oxidoreductase [Cytobacillus gottheilii]